MTKAMIFDADGTLLDSMGLWRRIDRDFLLAHRFPYSPQISRQVETMSLRQSAAYFQQLLAEQEKLSVPQIMTQLEDMCADAYENEVQAMPFVPEFLQAARQAGYRMCVATASQKAQIEKALRRLDLLSYFSFIMDADEAGVSKTDPAIFLSCAKRLDSVPGETWVFEDAPHAAQTAADAGFLVIGVHTPETDRHKQQMLRCCRRWVSSFSQLLDREKKIILG